MGPRVVLRSIIESFPDAEISIAIVWINKLAADSREAAGMFNDPRVGQFYDPQQLSGKAVADSLGWQGRTAWDIYLFYAAGPGRLGTPTHRSMGGTRPPVYRRRSGPEACCEYDSAVHTGPS